MRESRSGEEPGDEQPQQGRGIDQIPFFDETQVQPRSEGTVSFAGVLLLLNAGFVMRCCIGLVLVEIGMDRHGHSEQGLTEKGQH